MAEEQVDLFTGALILRYVDYRLPGPNGMDLEVVRWYTSKIRTWGPPPGYDTDFAEESNLGIGWMMHPGRLWVNPLTGGVPKYVLELPGGGKEEFFHNNVLTPAPAGDYISKGGWALVSDSGWTVTDPTGTKWHFPSATAYTWSDYRYLEYKEDTAGNRITHTYEKNYSYINWLTATENRWNRQVTFQYINHVNHPGSPKRLSTMAVKNTAGQSITYTYDVAEPAYTSKNVLASVTLPTGLETLYDYYQVSSLPELHTITLPQGGTITYAYADNTFYNPHRNTYQSNERTRVVSSRAASGGTWTYSYATETLPDNPTAVTDPSNNVQKHYFNRRGNTGTDQIWRAGTLNKTEVYSGSSTLLKKVEHVYTGQRISNDEISTQNGYFEDATRALLTQTTVTLYGGTSRSSETLFSGHDNYGNVGTVEERDWDGAAYRKTQYEYEHSNGDGDDATFRSNNLVQLVTRELRKTASGTKKAETTREYYSCTSCPAGEILGHLSSEDRWYDTLSGENSTSGTTHTTFEYDARGDIQQQVEENGTTDITTDFVHTYGVLSSVTVNDDQLFSRTIDQETGLVLAQTDENSKTTNFTYDDLGRLTKIDPPEPGVLDTNIEYDNSAAQYVIIKRGTQEKTRYSFDTLGRPYLVRTRLSGSTYSYARRSYNAAGQLYKTYELALSDPTTNAPAIAYTYDGLGRPATETTVDGTTQYSYTSNTKTVTEPGGNTVVYTFDDFGRVSQLQDQEGSVTTYDYDLLDRLKTIDPPGSATSNSTFTYNALGYLTEETRPESGRTRYTYDKLGNRTKRNDAQSINVYYDYDPRRRLTLIDYPSGTDARFYYDGDAVPGASATYVNARGHLSGMTDGTGTTLWTDFNADGQLQRRENRIDGSTLVTNWTYDTRGNVESLKYPTLSGQSVETEVTYTYNDADLPDYAALVGGRVVVTDVNYSAAFKPSRIDYDNGVSVYLPTSAQSRNRPEQIYTTGVTEDGVARNLLLDFQEYNARGLLKKVATTQGFVGQPDVANRVDQYTYDSRRNLEQVQYGTTGTVTYTADARGNLTSRNSTQWPSLNFSYGYTDNKINGWSYNLRGDLLNDGAHSYGYHPGGFLQTVDSAAWSYSYDGQGQRTLTSGPSGLVRLDLFGDRGELLARRERQGAGVADARREFIWLGDQLVAEKTYANVDDGESVFDSLRLTKTGEQPLLSWTDPAGCGTPWEVWRAESPNLSDQQNMTPDGTTKLSYLDELTTLLDTQLFYDVRTARSILRWHVNDHLGSTRYVLDGEGGLDASYELFPFGEPKTDGCRVLDGGYTAKLRDDESGLSNFGARFYNWRIARFMSPDPGDSFSDLDPRSVNRYAYAFNDAVNFTDPDGRAGVRALVGRYLDWTSGLNRAAAARVISWGASLQEAGAAANDGSFGGVAVDATLGIGGSMVQGIGDTLNLGTSVGEVHGTGGTGESYVRASAAEAGRAGGLILMLTSVAGGARAASTTLNEVRVPTASGDIIVPRGWVRSMADNGRGVVYRPAGSRGDAGAVRAAMPDGWNPAGYAKVYNLRGQPIDPWTGRTLARAPSHLPLTGRTTTQPPRTIPVAVPPERQ
ncbi:MAG: RHS repeat-associated core domain-containing protein [Acidobacteria bacterium]|nr:RHS repeat-associated core domain-containing protein [Acidobacteriota bacterium]